MKTMIIGDIHFGIRNNSETYLNFQKTWFYDELIPSIKKHKCDNVVFLGDIFDSRNSLSPMVINTAREIFKDLTKVSKIHCILGNHDIFFRNKKSVHSLTILEDQGVTVYEKPTEIELGDEKVLMLPWVIADELEDVKNLLVNNNYDMLFGHLEINGFEMVPGVVEQKGLNSSLFANCKNVYSGHFHLKRDNGNINYVGTPYELTWSDFSDPKGVLIYDHETKKEKFIKTNHTPKHVKVSFNKTPIEKLSPTIISNNIVRLKFNQGVKEIDKINYLEKLNSLQPISCSVDDEDFDDIDSDSDIESSIKDTVGFLEEYVSVIETPEEIEKEKLLEYLKDIYDNSI